MNLKSITVVTLFAVSTFSSKAQKGNDDKATTPDIKTNLLKVNLTALVLKNYAVQYEHLINRKFSVALGFRTMPSTTLPFNSAISDAIGADDPETQRTIQTMRLSNFSITPEFRFYVSKKGFGRGFYIAPFYRFAKFKTDNAVFTYQNALNVSSTIALSGDITANTGGILFGIQKNIGQHLVLDLWLLGPHYGAAKGNFSGVSSKTLTPDEQADLKQEIE